MTFDLSKFTPERRAKLIKQGKIFSSLDTLAQADQTLSSLKLHGAKLVNHGFNAADATELASARDALQASGVGREKRRVGKKQVSLTQATEMRSARALRVRAISVLKAVRRVLGEDASEASVEAVHAIDAMLELHSTVANKPELIAVQLEALRDMLAQPVVAKAAASRGGPELANALIAQVSALRAAKQASASRAGTPEETEKLDLLDGIIVALVRNANSAAKAAAMALGEPTVAEAFKLTALYRTRGRKKKSASAQMRDAA